VEGSEVWGNSTLFDGVTVETGAASSDLALRNGVRVQLGKGSRARVWENRLVLERGTGQVAASTPFDVVVAGLAVRGESQGARLRVGVDKNIQVAALAGTARVSGTMGLTLASIPAGRSMGFSMQAAQNGSITRTGCLLYKDTGYILQDDNTQEVVEVRGPDLALNTGNRVEIAGTVSTTRPTVSIATSLINAVTISTLGQGGCLSVASTLDARTSAPQANAPEANGPKPASTPKKEGGGLSTGAKVAIIVAVAGGGAGGAIAAMGGKKSTSP